MARTAANSAISPLDLSLLPPPTMVVQLDHEAILAEMLADLRARDPVFDALARSDPVYKVLEVADRWAIMADRQPHPHA